MGHNPCYNERKTLFAQVFCYPYLMYYARGGAIVAVSLPLLLPYLSLLQKNIYKKER